MKHQQKDEDITKAIIDQLDFTLIAKKIMKQKNWTISETQQVEQYYKNFLLLQKKYGDSLTLPPSTEIDLFWHEHILHTARYHQDCQKIFQKYLHHYPEPEAEEEITSSKKISSAFHMTQSLHKKEFGDYIYEVVDTRLLFLRFFFRTIFNAARKVFHTLKKANRIISFSTKRISL